MHAKKLTAALIGISGFSYPEWHHPGGLYQYVKRGKELDFYSRNFDFVEVNNSFYREPTDELILKWKNSVPPHFMFSLKVHRFFTHLKRLNVDLKFKSQWEVFWNKCLMLEEKLGPLLFQLPPLIYNSSGLNSMRDRLHRLSELLPDNHQFAFEVRDPSWNCEEVASIFKQYNWCLCVIHVNNVDRWAGNLSSGFFPHPELWLLAKWGTYFRFHGSEGKYQGRYSNALLEDVSHKIQHFLKLDRQIYVAFNNTNEQCGRSALNNARTLNSLLSNNVSFLEERTLPGF